MLPRRTTSWRYRRSSITSDTSRCTSWRRQSGISRVCRRSLSGLLWSGRYIASTAILLKPSRRSPAGFSISALKSATVAASSAVMGQIYSLMKHCDATEQISAKLPPPARVNCDLIAISLFSSSWSVMGAETRCACRSWLSLKLLSDAVLRSLRRRGAAARAISDGLAHPSLNARLTASRNPWRSVEASPAQRTSNRRSCGERDC